MIPAEDRTMLMQIDRNVQDVPSMSKLKKGPRKAAKVQEVVREEGSFSALHLSVSDARTRFSEIVNRVAFAKDRVELHRHGKARAAIVPPEDLERLRELEDRLDAEAARRALAEPGERRPHHKVREELGLR